MKNSIFPQSYVELLAEVRTKVENFLASTANEYIPKMYYALRNENRDMSVQDARKRIQKDCTGIWARRTIITLQITHLNYYTKPQNTSSVVQLYSLKNNASNTLIKIDKS
jgi:hypothetical protein